MTKHRRLGLRRGLAAASAATLMSIGLAACGDDDSSSGSNASGELRVVLNAQPATLDPIVGPRSGQIVWATVIEPLVDTDENLDPTDTGLITGWERTDDTTWTFTVRDGVTFSNGEPADAEAVVNTLELTRDTEASILKSYWTNVTSIEAPDATTVVLKTTTPQYNIPNQLGTVYLVPPEYYEKEGPEGFAAAPVGTGPYLFDGQRAGRDMTVVVNDDYWGEAPTNEKITFSWSTEAAQRLALLQSGSADVAFDLPPTQQDEAESAGLEVVTAESAIKIVAFLQTDKAPFDDPKMAEAAALAVDRDQIVDGIFDGKAVADGGLLNMKPGETPAEQVDADPEAAKALVGNAKVEVPISYPAGQYTNIEEVAQAMGGMLEEAGFKVSYNAVDYGTLVTQVVGRELNGIYLLAGVPNVAVPDFFASGFMKTVSISGNCPDPKIDAMVAEALEQPDAEASAPIYEELNTIGVVEKHCYIPLYRQLYAYATTDDVEGIDYSPLNAVDFTDATIG
ncbi:ABC transporter substrate-binding protein [Nocardioides sp.]|uniref:ABC transporter substrate-binding protein n=1 Tax=Nocardioides sp. TaxID=35761 RepID=UPI002735ACD3|nr:ABC transporter substrate-binding protein [Nocardioides sp.]MDP3891466.1 ABC transporter substrate-binding protein [Nocardioides sp.]